MIERQSSASLVNEIINHPSVYPWVCGPLKGPIDLSEPIQSGNYIALFGEHGGFLFWKLTEGIYDAHSAVMPQGRGRWALETAHQALAWMFGKEHAVEIIMQVPKGNLAVRALVRAVKARPVGTIENGWWIDGKNVDADIFSLLKTDWERCLLQYH